MNVRNIRGTSDNDCRCGSWLTHWSRFTNQPLTTQTRCSVLGCFAPATCGAHIQVESGLFNAALGGIAAVRASHWHIVPMCQQHNMATGTLTVRSVPLASANVSETCGAGIGGLLSLALKGRKF